MTLEKYLSDNYPLILEEYHRYMKSNALPEVGDLVKSLRTGFGGRAGEILIVTEISETGITLVNGNCEYYSEIENWHKDLVIYKKKEVKK